MALIATGFFWALKNAAEKTTACRPNQFLHCFGASGFWHPVCIPDSCCIMEKLILLKNLRLLSSGA
jgi:hypothetical protein